MTDKQATPRPWKLRSPKDRCSIYSRAGESIATTKLYNRNLTNRNNARDEANAELIVESANSYDSMKAALDDARRRIVELIDLLLAETA